MSFTKINKEDYVNKGVTGLPDQPALPTLEMQRKFDELSTDVIIPKFNELSAELDEEVKNLKEGAEGDLLAAVTGGTKITDITQITSGGMFKDEGSATGAPDADFYTYYASAQGWSVNIIAISLADASKVFVSKNSTSDGSTWTNSGWARAAMRNDLSSYIPLTGGTLTGNILLSDAVCAYPNVMLGYSSDGEGAKIQYDKGNKNAAFTVSTDGRIVDFFIFPKADLKSVLGLHCDDQWFDVFGSHNKHTGSYTGNGSATERTIDTGGYGGILTIRSTQGIAFVTVFGTFCITNSGTVKYITNTSWDGYKVTISTDDALLNGSGVTYDWYVL